MGKYWKCTTGCSMGLYKPIRYSCYTPRQTDHFSQIWLKWALSEQRDRGGLRLCRKSDKRHRIDTVRSAQNTWNIVIRAYSQGSNKCYDGSQVIATGLPVDCFNLLLIDCGT